MNNAGIRDIDRCVLAAEKRGHILSVSGVNPPSTIDGDDDDDECVIPLPRHSYKYPTNFIDTVVVGFFFFSFPPSPGRIYKLAVGFK